MSTQSAKLTPKTNRHIYVQKGVLSNSAANKKKAGINIEQFDLYDWEMQNLIGVGLINADPCCDDYVANERNTRLPNQAATSEVVLTAADSGSVIYLNSLTGATVTLPTAAAGLEFTFISQISNTSNTYSIQGATSADLMIGSLINIDSDTSNAVAAWTPNGTTNYKITGNTNTTALLKGSIVKLIGVAANLWEVSGTTISSGVVSSPFAG